MSDITDQVSIDSIWQESGSGCVIHMAAVMGDLPLLRALLVRGANINAYGAIHDSKAAGGDGLLEAMVAGTPVMMVLQSMMMQGDVVRMRGVRGNSALPPRSYYRALEFLLSVGADPNAQPDPDRGDILAPRAHASAFHVALAIPDVALAKKACLLLLIHKADPHAAYDPYVRGRQRLGLPYEDQGTEGQPVARQVQRGGGALAPQLKTAVKLLISQYQSTERPARRCPCGSDKAFAACHGAPTGAALHPKARCPCKGPKGKTFGRCCMKCGANFWRAGLGTFVQTRTISMDSAPKNVQTLLKQNMHTELGCAMEDMRKLAYPMICPMVMAGQMDMAFAHACLRCDFQYARPWRDNNVPILDTNEMVLRQKEWNAYVDEYVACRDSPTPVCKGCKESEGSVITMGSYKGSKCVKKVGSCHWGDDLRSPLEVAQAAKVAWTGGPLYNTCGNPECGKVEEEPSSFQLCSKCKQTRFCSRECLKAAWKPFHRQVCGTNAAEPRLPSQVFFLLV